MGPEEESDETVESEGHANENEVEEDGEWRRNRVDTNE